MISNVGNKDVSRLVPGSREPGQPSFRPSSPAGPLRPTLHSQPGDRFSLNQKSGPTTIYSASLSSRAAWDHEQLQGLVARTLAKQGLASTITTGNSVDADEIGPAQARGLVAADGFYGVAQTSDRIVEFAIAAAGDDPGRLEEIKRAVDMGFSMAREALGGGLPDISQKTYAAVMDKLDAWAEGS